MHRQPLAVFGSLYVGLYWRPENGTLEVAGRFSVVFGNLKSLRLVAPRTLNFPSPGEEEVVLHGALLTPLLC